MSQYQTVHSISQLTNENHMEDIHMKVEDLPLILKEYEPSDFEGCLHCIRCFYGEGYPYPEYLQRETLAARMANGNMILCVAKIGEKIVGTVAAELCPAPFEDSVLLFFRNVDPEFGGRGIASKQFDYLLKLVQARFPSAISLYADVMTHNIVSQSSLVHKNFAICGLRLMLYKNEIIVPHLPFAKGTKMSQAIFVKLLAPLSLVLHSPKQYRPSVASLYSALGCSVTFNDSMPTKETSKITVSRVPLHEKTEIVVECAGKDIDTRLEQIIGETMSTHATRIAYLNMLSDGCENAANVLLSRGFYYSGVKPGNRNGEYLLFADTKNCTENMDAVALVDSGKALLNTIITMREEP